VAELPTRVVLIGFMGSGKSTIGPLVAEKLGYTFEDMDRRIEERTGQTIAALFEERGEEAFREEELAVALEVSRLERRVIAAGGGAFARPATREVLQRGAVVVWLRCDLETVIARVPPDGTRPLAGNREIMRGLLAQREPSYSLADENVDTSGSAPGEVADQVVERIERRGQATTR